MNRPDDFDALIHETDRGIVLTCSWAKVGPRPTKGITILLSWGSTCDSQPFYYLPEESQVDEEFQLLLWPIAKRFNEDCYKLIPRGIILTDDEKEVVAKALAARELL